MRTIRLLLMLVTLVALSSCEKFLVDGTSSNEDSENGNVTITVSHHILDSFNKDSTLTRGTEEVPELEDLCTRLSFAFFKDDEKVKTLHQQAGSDNFGTISTHLDEGTYRIVVIAHSGKGNCTISSPEKVTFYKNKLTDTFIHYGTLEVEEDDETQQEVSLTRSVAKIRLSINDAIPASASQLRLYYTGGSSTLDATTGQGIVNSRQTEYVDIVAGQKEYDVYTFPHSDGRKLSLTVTVLDKDGAEIASKRIENIPVERNHITTCVGNLFDGNSEDGGTGEKEDTGGDSSQGEKETTGGITLKFDTQWAGELFYEF